MSIEIHAFIKKANVPSREDWQKSIEESGYKMSLDEDLKAFESSGFVPCKLDDIESGFEINYETTETYIETYPTIKEKLTDQDYCITFRLGSSTDEYTCVLIASLALLRTKDAIIYDPADDMFYTQKQLEDDIAQCVKK